MVTVGERSTRRTMSSAMDKGLNRHKTERVRRKVPDRWRSRNVALHWVGRRVSACAHHPKRCSYLCRSSIV